MAGASKVLAALDALRELAPVGGSLSELAKKIRVFHSSPHDLDKFDLGKVGTGEGHASYGHGLYFAENPKVSGQGGEYWQQFNSRRYGLPHDERMTADTLKAHGFDRAKAAEYFDRQIERSRRDIDQWRIDTADPGLSTLQRKASAEDIFNAEALIADYTKRKELLTQQPIIGPRTYEVDIAARPEQFLDWDKPLHAQPEGVRENLSNLLGERKFSYMPARKMYERQLEGHQYGPTDVATGENLYSRLVETTRSKLDASRALRNNDIPGIRYMDQWSRLYDERLADAQRRFDIRGTPADYQVLQKLKNNPEKTYNYVVNDPSLLSIARKYGVVGAPVGGLMMGGYDGER